MDRLSLLSTTILALLLTTACQEYAEPSLTPGQQKKVEAHLLDAPPAMQHTVGAIIEDQVELLGYDLDRAVAKPGETITITYYLKALSEKMGDNKIFVHLQGRKGDRAAWMNLDHNPVEGLLPLRQLKKGQIVKDVQRITVSANFPAGQAHIYWGLWRGNDRLKITNAAKVPHDKEGRVKVASVMIKGGKKAAPKRGPRPSATAQRVPEGDVMTIDGVLDEPVWAKAPYTAWWVTPDGKNGQAPRTRARFAWTPTHLYVGVESKDDDVWSTFTARDSNTWEQEVIELFIDADGDKKDYLELQVTPANVVFDAKFARHRSDLAVARAWNMAGLETAVKVDGTLNERTDTDTGYVVEMAIPVAQVPGAKPLAHRATWRVNLFRWDLPKAGRQKAAAFSAPIVGDFHALNMFGHLRFRDSAAMGGRPDSPKSP